MSADAAKETQPLAPAAAAPAAATPAAGSAKPSAADKAKAAVQKFDPKGPRTFLDAAGMNTNLFGCFSDLLGCGMSCCCPCVVDGITRSLIDERNWSMFDALCCTNPYQTRQSLRVKYNMGFDNPLDFVGSCCCMVCGIHQNAREYANRSGKEAQWFPPPTQKASL